MYDSRVVPDYLHKKRIDSSLVLLKLVKTRQKALALIMAGNVFLNEKRILKPGSLIFQNSIIRIKKNLDWVSRGGTKLNKAIEKFDIDVKDKVCLDIGCSTGGFSEVLLSRGAKFVYAVDVGYGQFDWKLRNSKKIKLFERTNAKFLTKELIPELLDILVCDVSFISLIKAIEPSLIFLGKKFQIVVLIKPQFEVERNLVGKGGIVKDPKIHKNVCKKVDDWFKKKLNISHTEIIESPIRGQKGNKEFLIHIKN